VVSEGAVLGDRVSLQANVFIGKGVAIGDGARIESCVSIQDFSEIGEDVLIHSGASIGCDGFGFAPSEGGEWEKIPQIGRVIIGDRVEIGPNCTIDRATFGATVIGPGTKLGAQVHVAHNCEVGRDSMMVGHVAVGGSSKIGPRFLSAGMTAIADHVNIGERVTVAGRSGVTKDIPDGLTVSGFPAQPHAEEMKFQASLRRVASGNLARELRSLRKRLEALEKLNPGPGDGE
jgi:UDP-3-O-[3-hydroxymyristoyl] glucosamine N-acyltransferase